MSTYVDIPGIGIQLMTPPTGEIFKFDNTKEVVLECLKIIASEGSYEAGAVTAFNAICKKYDIDVSYDDMTEQLLDEGKLYNYD